MKLRDKMQMTTVEGGGCMSLVLALLIALAVVGLMWMVTW